MVNRTYHQRGKLVHGFHVRKHPSYSSWVNMMTRCTNENSPNYKNYGARGISVCDRWSCFENFAEDMGVRPSKNHSIERLDNNKNYDPENCTWATRTEQSLNRRTFINNTSGSTGIVLIKKLGRYSVRYDVYGIRYTVGGTFATAEEAEAARIKLISFINDGDIESAKAMCDRPARYDSKTSVRGISQNSDGFIVRATKNGNRIYIGFSKNYETALEMLEKWKKENS